MTPALTVLIITIGITYVSDTPALFFIRSTNSCALRCFAQRRFAARRACSTFASGSSFAIRFRPIATAAGSFAASRSCATFSLCAAHSSRVMPSGRLRRSWVFSHASVVAIGAILALA